MCCLFWAVLQWTEKCIYPFELQCWLDTCPGVGLLDLMATLFWVYWRASILFSIMDAPIYIWVGEFCFLSFFFFLTGWCHLFWIVIKCPQRQCPWQRNQSSFQPNNACPGHVLGREGVLTFSQITIPQYYAFQCRSHQPHVTQHMKQPISHIKIIGFFMYWVK